MSTTRIRTPASTSNLGPGFDFLGLALELWLEVECELIDASQHELLCGEDESAKWPREGNLLTAAYDAALREFGAEARRARFSVRSEIPLCRGLGSSGAAVAAGLRLGAAAAGQLTPDLARMAELGLGLEGHPDNSSASLFGGCTLGVPLGNGALRVVRHTLSESLHYAIAWPSTTLSTSAAREVLPQSVPFADAIENPRRLALLLEGLRTGDPQLIALGAVDRLHVAARTMLIDGAGEALRAARDAGAFAATISGSGSALIAIHDDRGRTEHIAQVMAQALDAHHPSATAKVSRASQAGATFLE